jgi:ketol-acid reductoisomerase
MKDILAEIQDGSFANRFMAEIESGGEFFAAEARRGREHQIEVVGRELRA